MPKFKFVNPALKGKTENLAGVGVVKHGDIILLTKEQAAGVAKHAPEQFEAVPDNTPLTQALKPKVEAAPQAEPSA